MGTRFSINQEEATFVCTKQVGMSTIPCGMVMVKVKQMDKAKVKDEAKVHDAFSLSTTFSQCIQFDNDGLM